MSDPAIDGAGVPEPALAYDRIAENRRKTTLLLGVFAVAASVPYLLFVLHFFGSTIAMLVVGPAFDFAEESLWTVLGISFGVAVAMTAVTTVLVHRRSASLVLRIAGARPLPEEEAPRLRRVVENLCIGAGLRPPRLYVVESDATNLAATGLDRDHASLVVTRGLLEILEPRELEGAVAQELSQIGNEDVRTATVVGALVSLLWWPLLVVRLLRRVKRGIESLGRTTGRPLLIAFAVGLLVVFPLLVLPIFFVGALALMPVAMLVAIPLAVTTSLRMIDADPAVGWTLLAVTVLTAYAVYVPPILGFVIRRWTGHHRELRADAEALVLTRHPTGLARALAKTTAGRNAELTVHPAVAPLFLVDPLPRGIRRRLLSTHPPVDERIDALLSMTLIDPREIEDAGLQGLLYRRGSDRDRPRVDLRPDPKQIGAISFGTESGEAGREEPAIARPADELSRPNEPTCDSSDAAPATAPVGLRCPTVRDSTEDYLGGVVEESRAAGIRAHIASCPACDEYVTLRLYERITS